MGVARGQWAETSGCPSWFLVYYVAPLLCIAINCGLIIGHLHGCRGTLATTSSYFLSTSPGPSGETDTRVSLLWEVTALTAILLVCLAPCWNLTLYFLLSRPAVRLSSELCCLPSFISTCEKTLCSAVISLPSPPRLPRPQPPTHSHTTHRPTQ